MQPFLWGISRACAGDEGGEPAVAAVPVYGGAGEGGGGWGGEDVAAEGEDEGGRG